MDGINLIKVKCNSKLKRDKEFVFKIIKASIKNINKFYIVENNISQNKIIVSKIYEKENEIPRYFEKSMDTIKEIKELLIQKSTINEIYTKNKKFFDDLKDKIGYNKGKAVMTIQEMISYFNIKGNIEFINGIFLILKSKIYEIELKSIIFFFENFQKDNKQWNEILPDKYKYLSKMDYKDLKISIEELKENGIYDYQSKHYYLNLFTSLYEKKEAINFLLSKTASDIHILIDNLKPNNRNITKKDLEDTEKCINIFTKFKELKDNFRIFHYIKLIDLKTIERFIHYSYIYTSIIDLYIDFRYEIKKPFREDGYGNIFLAFDNKEKREVVIKKIDKSQINEEIFNREINSMKEVNCQYSVEIYDYYWDKNYYYIVMEKCDEFV